MMKNFFFTLLLIYLLPFNTIAQQKPIIFPRALDKYFNWELAVIIPELGIRFSHLQPHSIMSILSWDEDIQNGVESSLFLQFYDESMNLFEIIYDLQKSEITSTYFKILDEVYNVDRNKGFMENENSGEKFVVRCNLFIPPHYSTKNKN